MRSIHDDVKRSVDDILRGRDECGRSVHVVRTEGPDDVDHEPPDIEEEDVDEADRPTSRLAQGLVGMACWSGLGAILGPGAQSQERRREHQSLQLERWYMAASGGR